MPAIAGPRFAVNCSILFTELPLLQRPAAAKQAGFRAVEFWWPFDAPVPGDREADAFVRAVSEAGVALVGLNFAAGDMPAGDRGLVSWPQRPDRPHFRPGLRRHLRCQSRPQVVHRGSPGATTWSSSKSCPTSAPRPRTWRCSTESLSRGSPARATRAAGRARSPCALVRGRWDRGSWSLGGQDRPETPRPRCPGRRLLPSPVR